MKGKVEKQVIERVAPWTWHDALVFTTMMACTMFMLFVTINIYSFFAERHSCRMAMNASSGYQYRFDFWDGCLVRTPDGIWINDDDLLEYLRPDGANDN